MIQTSCAHHRICSLLRCSSSNLIFLPSCWRLFFFSFLLENRNFILFLFLLLQTSLNSGRIKTNLPFPFNFVSFGSFSDFFFPSFMTGSAMSLAKSRKSVCCYDREFLCLSQTLAGVVKFPKIEKKRRRRKRVSATFIPNLWTVKNNPLTPLVKGSNKTVEP